MGHVSYSLKGGLNAVRINEILTALNAGIAAEADELRLTLAERRSIILPEQLRRLCNTLINEGTFLDLAKRKTWVQSYNALYGGIRTYLSEKFWKKIE